MDAQAKKNIDETSLTISMPKCFDFDAYPDFHKAYEGTAGQYDKYIIDFNDTQTIKTCATGMLLQIWEYLGCDRSKIILINCNPEIMELMEICKFNSYFDIHPKDRMTPDTI